MKALTIACVVAALWWLTADIKLDAGKRGYESESLNIVALAMFICLRGSGVLTLLASAGVAGAMVFIRERRLGTLEQLIVLPISRAELIAVRVVHALAAVLPAAMLAVGVDLLRMPATPGRYDLSMLPVALASDGWAVGGVLFVCIAAMTLSLGGRRAVASVVVVFLGTLHVGVLCSRCIIHWSLTYAFLVLAVANVVATVFLLWLLARQFDSLALEGAQELRDG